jgi:hypothetical protein
MIHSICGLQNGGKTLTGVFYCYLDYLRGRKILSNISLGFPHYLINRDFLLYLAMTQPQLSDCSFLIDECPVYFDGSTNSRDNRIFSYLLIQSSKNNWNLYAISQHIGMMQKRLRDNVNRFSKCERVIKIDNEYRALPEKLTEYRDLRSFHTDNNLNYNDILHIKVSNFTAQLNYLNELQFTPKTNMYLKASVYFKLYNTKEKKRMET